MYAEIKSNNTILINRLDENESILLEEILKKANQSNMDLKMKGLINESGDFGGVFIEVFEKSDAEIIE